MYKVLVLGGGKIGSLITLLLDKEPDYKIHLIDQNIEILNNEKLGSSIEKSLLDISDHSQLTDYLSTNKFDAIISALPYYCNPNVAKLAHQFNLHYFDLTEDVNVTKQIKKIAYTSERAVVPQGGLAPGFISIVTQDLIHKFDLVDAVKMRVGALPVRPSNVLKYSLTWSTDGLINEYGNTCFGIIDGNEVKLQPLEGYETIEIDGLLYEAFNTSGGIGTLADSYRERVNSMDYKTLRYPGHCEKIRFLMNDLKLNKDRSTLKTILEKAIPKTNQDVVLVFSSVSGWKNKVLFEKTYFKKIYPQSILGTKWSAIQVTTASSICTIVDMVLFDPNQYRGFVTQESFRFDHFLKNRFASYFT